MSENTWRPISEADEVKRAETPVLLWRGDGGMSPAVYEWSPTAGCWWSEDGSTWQADGPTHFCLLPPLPASPADTTGEA